MHNTQIMDMLWDLDTLHMNKPFLGNAYNELYLKLAGESLRVDWGIILMKNYDSDDY